MVGIWGKRGREQRWRDGGELPASPSCRCCPPFRCLHPSTGARGVRHPKKRTLQATARAKCLLVAFGKVCVCAVGSTNSFYLKICCLLTPGNFSLVLCYRMEILGLCTMFLAHPILALPPN